MSAKPKPPMKDRLLDKVPVIGRARRVRGWFRRHKGWIYFGLALVCLFIAGPALRIVATFFSILAPMIRTLLDNPVGRVIFYSGLALIIGWILWRRVRMQVYRVFGLNAMRAFLDGMNLMILGRWSRAIPRFEKVVRTPRWIRLEDGVPEHRDIRSDAMLKIALCHLKTGRPNEAKAWLLRVHESDILSPHVRSNLVELRALSYDQNDEIEAETILKELEKAGEREGQNRRVLTAIRDRLEAVGELDRAAQATRRLVKASQGVQRDVAEDELVLLEYRIAHKAVVDGSGGVGHGKGGKPLKALKARTSDPRSAVLLGDVALEQGDLRGAFKAWSRAVSLPVFDRIEKLLQEGRVDGEKERRMLLEYFPYSGTMIVLARHYARRGDYRKAKSAVERAIEAAGPNLEALRVYAQALEQEGDTTGAAALYRQALASSFD